MNERAPRPWSLLTTAVLGAIVLASCTATAATPTRTRSAAPSAAAKTAAATASMPMDMSMPPASSAATPPATVAASVAASAAPAATTAATATTSVTTPAPAATTAPTAAPVATPAPTVQTSSGPIAVTLVDVAIRLDRTTTSAGAVTFSIKNAGTVAHELIVLKTDVPQDQIPTDPSKPGSVTQPGFIGQSATLQPGGTTTLTLTLASGKYVLMCNQPAHYLIGMHAGFTVN